jgi:cysteinyl-tRNA synthetase
VLRFNMLRTHYRQPIDWTIRGLEESEKVLDRWYGYADAGGEGLGPDVLEALADDLNTPRMIAELHALDGRGAHGELVGTLRTLGFLRDSAEQWKARRRAAIQVDPDKVEALIASRRDARAQKNWSESDRIRDELSALGVVVKDNKDGTTTWEVAR